MGTEGTCFACCISCLCLDISVPTVHITLYYITLYICMYVFSFLGISVLKAVSILNSVYDAAGP